MEEQKISIIWNDKLLTYRMGTYRGNNLILEFRILEQGDLYYFMVFNGSSSKRFYESTEWFESVKDAEVAAENWLKFYLEWDRFGFLDHVHIFMDQLSEWIALQIIRFAQKVRKSGLSIWKDSE
jgi:hypothetical protein